MCGRYALYGPASRSNRIEFEDLDLDWTPRYNIAPTQRAPVYRVHPEHGPELVPLRWGLVPSWAKDVAIGARLINARSETVHEKPSFRVAFRRRRCLVPMSGFYEWRTRPDGAKAPHFIWLLNEPVFAVAGLFEWWQAPGGEPVESFTLLTCAANAFMQPLHDRMPVILAREHHDHWLDPTVVDPAALSPLMVPFAADEMAAREVSTRVNAVRNDDPSLLEPGSGA